MKNAHFEIKSKSHCSVTTRLQLQFRKKYRTALINVLMLREIEVILRLLERKDLLMILNRWDALWVYFCYIGVKWGDCCGWADQGSQQRVGTCINSSSLPRDSDTGPRMHQGLNMNRQNL